MPMQFCVRYNNVSLTDCLFCKPVSVTALYLLQPCDRTDLYPLQHRVLYRLSLTDLCYIGRCILGGGGISRMMPTLKARRRND